MATSTTTRVLKGTQVINGVSSLSDREIVVTTRTTNKTANYLTKVKKGEFIPPLNYTYRLQKTNYPVGYHSDIWKSGVLAGKVKTYWSGCIQSGLGYTYFGDITRLEPTADEKIALDTKIDNKVLDKIKGDRINVAQALAERKQTVSLIGNTISRFVRGSLALRRGNLRGFTNAFGISEPSRRTVSRFNKHHRVKPIDAFSNYWLEYTYGWTPFLMDVYGAVEAFKRPIQQPVGVVRASAVMRREDVVNTNGQYFRLRTYRYLSVRRSKVVYYELDDDAESLMVKTASEIGLTNPVLLAWELLPFSFVVDWFLPIGNYLSALDATFGLKFKSGTRQDKWIRSSYRTETGAGLPGGTVYTTGNSRSRYSEIWYDRFTVGDFPTPVFPSFKPPWSASHVTSGLALLNQIFLQGKK